MNNNEDEEKLLNEINVIQDDLIETGIALKKYHNFLLEKYGNRNSEMINCEMERLYEKISITYNQASEIIKNIEENKVKI